MADFILVSLFRVVDLRGLDSLPGPNRGESVRFYAHGYASIPGYTCQSEDW